ncbi:MAG: usg protein [Inquilinaceae bacterium]
MTSLSQQLQGYRLTTAEILYHMPDHPGILQTYIWQALDLAPKFPELRKFLAFWQRELDGPLHSVKLASMPVISASELAYMGTELRLN